MYYDIKIIRGIKILIAGDENGIVRLKMDGLGDRFLNENNLKRNTEVFKKEFIQLEEYFEGKRTKFEMRLNPQGTDFQKKVWLELEKIPYGEIRTYKDIAIAAGNPKASRAVGLANNRNPISIVVPCHRVIGSNKKLVGYAHGLERKKRLLDSELINRTFFVLSDYYGDRKWWPAKDDFEMLVGAILTQNTNWQNVEKALANFGDNLTPERIINSDNEELAETIKPSGYYNQKASKLKELTRWFKTYDCNTSIAKQKSVEILRTELLNINGVGPETADSILVYALDKKSFVIDAYTRRIFSRVGLDVPKDYDEFRRMIELAVPSDLKTYNNYHAVIVAHATHYCKSNPICKDCPLSHLCEYKKENYNE
jgi:endonuclease-3 related protein